MNDDSQRQDGGDDAPSGPFPESTLGRPGPEAVPPGDPPYGDPPPPAFEGDPLRQADPPPGARPVEDPPRSPDTPSPPAPSLGERWASTPTDPRSASPGPGTPATRAGFEPGDPLGGSATPGFSHGDPLGTAAGTGGGSPMPGGYTSPPPPGAGGGAWGPPPDPPSSGQLVLSGWWRRAGAALIDGLIVGLVAVAVMAPLGLGLFSAGGTDASGVVAWFAAFMAGMLVVAVVALVYAPVMMGATNGRTVGRMATGIRVVRANGRPMTFGYAALREIVVKVLLINGIAGAFTFGLAGLIDVLWPLWDDENRALHDFVVDTRTVLA